MKRMIFTVAALSLLFVGHLHADEKDDIEKWMSGMTLEEKVRILVGTGMDGLNNSGPVVGETRSMVPGAAGTSYPIERLGIPAIVLADGPAGLRINAKHDFFSQTYYCTHFPIGTLLASSWDRHVVEAVGRAMGNEVLEYGADVLLAPGNNIHRNPLCGRNFEYFSEDPVLSGNIAASYIMGIQSNGVGTSLKHFALNNQETNRNNNDARASQRAIREIYLKAFEIAVKKGQPWTIMSSYNKINGTYASESEELLTTILRDEWGYQGMVMTDWFGGKDRPQNVIAGNDMIQPGAPRDPKKILDALKKGTITEEALNRNVRRILQLIVKCPHYRHYPYSNKPDLEAHAQVARDAAAEGIVLLKNEGGALPMGTNIKKIGLYGCSSYEMIPGGSGSGCVNSAYTISLVEGLYEQGYQTDKELYESYARHFEKFRKDHAKDGIGWFAMKPLPEEITFKAEQLAAQAASNDMAIITIGRNSGESKDRTSTDFNLNDSERRLITETTEAYHQTGKKVVVVLNVGGVIETASWKDIPDAILLPWQCGQEGGRPIADVLSGRKNPSGKLPMTFPVSLMDHYSSKNMPLDDVMDTKHSYYETNYEEDIYVGYRYFDTFGKPVSYPFGYGLSYTTFSYGSPVAKIEGDSIIVSVDVANTGRLAGKEVVQVYIKAPKGRVAKPMQELKAFAKTRELRPGDHQMLTIPIAKSDLASFNEAQSAWVVDAGRYTICVGTSSRDIKGTCNIRVGAQKNEVHNVLKPQETIQLLRY